MKTHRYTNMWRLFYFDAELPNDANKATIELKGMSASLKKLFWRFYWLEDVDSVFK